MAEMVAPAGTVVTVDAELGAKLARRGWKYTGEHEVEPVTEPDTGDTDDVPEPEPEPEPEPTGEHEAEPVKRKPGRPKKSD